MPEPARRVRDFLRDQRGLETVEWGIIVGLIVLAAIAGISFIGIWTKGQLESLEQAVNPA